VRTAKGVAGGEGGVVEVVWRKGRVQGMTQRVERAERECVDRRSCCSVCVNFVHSTSSFLPPIINQSIKSKKARTSGRMTWMER
jgi:hypothetical protein